MESVDDTKSGWGKHLDKCFQELIVKIKKLPALMEPSSSKHVSNEVNCDLKLSEFRPVVVLKKLLVLENPSSEELESSESSTYCSRDVNPPISNDSSVELIDIKTVGSKEAVVGNQSVANRKRKLSNASDIITNESSEQSPSLLTNSRSHLDKAPRHKRAREKGETSAVLFESSRESSYLPYVSGDRLLLSPVSLSSNSTHPKLRLSSSGSKEINKSSKISEETNESAALETSITSFQPPCEDKPADKNTVSHSFVNSTNSLTLTSQSQRDLGGIIDTSTLTSSPLKNRSAIDAPCETGSVEKLNDNQKPPFLGNRRSSIGTPEKKALENPGMASTKANFGENYSTQVLEKLSHKFANNSPLTNGVFDEPCDALSLENTHVIASNSKVNLKSSQLYLDDDLYLETCKLYKTLLQLNNCNRKSC